jgi:hypothetical protein
MHVCNFTRYMFYVVIWLIDGFNSSFPCDSNNEWHAENVSVIAQQELHFYAPWQKNMYRNAERVSALVDAAVMGWIMSPSFHTLSFHFLRDSLVYYLFSAMWLLVSVPLILMGI